MSGIDQSYLSIPAEPSVERVSSELPFTVRGSLPPETVEEFLRSTVVPVRLSCHRPSGDLWMLSLWFRYRDGYLECATAASADVVSFVRADDAVAFEVSTNDPPYRGVRGNGVAHIDADEEKALLTALVERYLGGTDSDLAQNLLSDERKEVRIRIDPETVYGWDNSGRMSERAGDGKS